eukprot:982068-Rhodomonas_salina.1
MFSVSNHQWHPQEGPGPGGKTHCEKKVRGRGRQTQTDRDGWTETLRPPPWTEADTRSSIIDGSVSHRKIQVETDKTTDTKLQRRQRQRQRQGRCSIVLRSRRGRRRACARGGEGVRGS